MPIFDYQCEDKECNHIFEVNLGRNELDEVVPKCPKCHRESKRIISGGSCFILKGEGWPGKEFKMDKEK